MRRCLGEEKPVIWYRSGRYHFFSDADMTIIDVMKDEHPGHTWCFVDSSAADLLPDQIYDPLNHLFPIYVTSPRQERWEKLDQLRQPKTSHHESMDNT